MSRLTSRNKRLLKNHDTLIQWIQHLLNTVVVIGTLMLCAAWKDGEAFGQHYRLMSVFAVLVMVITYNMFGVLRRFDNLVGGIQHLARAWGVVIIVLAWLAFLTKTSEQYSRQVIVYWAVLAFISQAIVQIILAKFYSFYNVKYRARIPTIVIGTGGSARHLAKSLAGNIWLRDEVMGIVSFEGDETANWTSTDLPILGRVDNLKKIIDEYQIKRVYLAPKFEQTAAIKDIQEELIDTK